MSKWYASCALLRLVKEKEPRMMRFAHGWCGRDKLPTRTGIDDELMQKRWEWQDERNSVMKHGTVVRPTMYMASLDIRTAFDEAKPKHVARILDDHNTHGWLIAAFLREMSGLSGTASFESVESRFSFNRCLRQGCVKNG